MAFSDSFKSHVHTITAATFEAAALEVFDYQWHQNELYQTYCLSLNKNPANTKALEQIPFLPISLFKNHRIITGQWAPEILFKSSGTTTSNRSVHYVKDVQFYLENTRQCFEYFYGPLSQYSLKAVLPSYQEQGDSSLIAMVDFFMRFTESSSGYFLTDQQELSRRLHAPGDYQQILLGVSFALLDVMEETSLNIPGSIVMETGGMKGRRHEITRQELHDQLTKGFGVEAVHSEYGMSELMSQAYAKSQGIFEFPPWSQVKVRDINDPFTYQPHGKTGGINVIDLANVDSCAFIETMDLGKKSTSGSFEILGRFDHSDIRGCNLLVA